MPASTPRGAPYPVAADNNDVPGDLQRLAEWVDLRPGISTLTTAQRDALAGVELWTGRVIFNTTTAKLEQWNGAAWTDDIAPQYLTKSEGDDTYEAKVSRTGATAGQVPTLQGDGTLAFAVTPAYELLSTVGVASGAAAVDIPLPTGYDHFRLVLMFADTGAHNPNLIARVSTDNAATFISTASYGYTMQRERAVETAPVSSNSNGATEMLLSDMVNASQGLPVVGTIDIFRSPQRWLYLQALMTSIVEAGTPYHSRAISHAVYKGAGTTHLRFLASSGTTFDTFKYHLLGVKE